MSSSAANWRAEPSRAGKRKRGRTRANDVWVSAEMPWGPVFNFRSEGRDFSDSQRCLVLASAFFEFTGKRYPKAKHRFTLTDSPMMAIAGLWRDGNGNQPPSFTMVTTRPGPVVARIHDRQVVVLAPRRLADWIYLSGPKSDVLAPLPASSLRVDQVRSGSD